MRFAANLSWLFQEWDFLDRFTAAADAGFSAVEVLFPYDHAPEAIAKALDRNRLAMALINTPPGDLARGDRGLAALPERKGEFRQAIGKALTYARTIGAGRIHVMAGVAAGSQAMAAYHDALRLAADAAAMHAIDITIEPLNPRDAPGYLLADFDLARDIIAELKLPNLKLQFDIYHRQIIHGDVMRGLEALMPITGHIQIASAPERAEPLTGELDDRRILRTIAALGYDGFIGCEYRPVAGTLPGLSWMQRL